MRKNIKRVYMDTYILQKDMRIRMPKEIVHNLNAKPGESYFEMFLDPSNKEIILCLKESKIHENR